MVYIFLADGFEEIEALATADMLRRAGIDTKTVSVQKRLCVKGAHNINVQADTFVENDLPDAEMLILPGGMPGMENLWACSKLRNLLSDFKGYIAAICASPSILGRLGLLEGRHAVCYPGFEPELKGAKPVADETVSSDGRIITSKGPGTVFDFALTIIRTLRGIKTSEKVREGMLCRNNVRSLD